MNTEAQRRAYKVYTDRLKASGGGAVTLRLSGPARAALRKLAAVHGSQAAAVEALLLAKPKATPVKVSGRIDSKTGEVTEGVGKLASVPYAESLPPYKPQFRKP